MFDSFSLLAALSSIQSQLTGMALQLDKIDEKTNVQHDTNTMCKGMVARVCIFEELIYNLS